MSAETKKNPFQMRKKEKLPVDTVPSSEDMTFGRGDQVVAVVMDVPHPKTRELEADIRPEALNTTQGVCPASATRNSACSYRQNVHTAVTWCESLPAYVNRFRV